MDLAIFLGIISGIIGGSKIIGKFRNIIDLSLSMHAAVQSSSIQ